MDEMVLSSIENEELMAAERSPPEGCGRLCLAAACAWREERSVQVLCDRLCNDTCRGAVTTAAASLLVGWHLRLLGGNGGSEGEEGVHCGEEGWWW